MVGIDRHLDELTHLYSLVGGDEFEIWWRTKEGEGLHEIVMNLEETSSSAINRASGRNTEQLVMDYWSELREEGLMENGALTELGEKWASRTDTGIKQAYDSDAVIFDSEEQEINEGCCYPDDFRALGEIYHVLGIEDVLPTMTAIMKDIEIAELEPGIEAQEKMLIHGFLDSKAYESGTYELDPAAEDLYEKLVGGADGDYAWARQNVEIGV